MADKKQALICGLCSDICKSPKVLPCHHTYCEHCLVDFVSKHIGGTFPCPSCNVETTAPPGGVSAFQTNFYIDSKDLETARDGAVCSHHSDKTLDLFCEQCDRPICLTCKITKHEGHKTQELAEKVFEAKSQQQKTHDGTVCSQHSDKNLDLFCVQCDGPICLTCKITKHEGHKTQELAEKVFEAKSQLQKTHAWLARSVQDVVQQVDLAKREQQAVRDKQAALAANIRDRQAALKAAADKYAEEALASLDKVTKDIWDSVQADLDCLQNNLRALQRSQRGVKEVLDSGSGLKQVIGAKEWEDRSVNVKTVKKWKTKKIRIRRPVCRFIATAETALQHIRDYMGGVAKTEMDVPAADVTVQEKFRCRQDPDTDVYGLCPLTDGGVCVSYEPHMLSCDLATEGFNTEGKSVSTMKFDTRRKHTVARNKNGKFMYMKPAMGSVYTYAKKCDSEMNRFFKVSHSTPEGATVFAVKIVSEEPFKTEKTPLFTIKCAAQRAFDVDSGEQLFVVLEDGKAPDYQRRVHLYRRFQPDPIDAYTPPVELWQPSDVCFYKKGGREVLLVADELNDVIHVVKVEKEENISLFFGSKFTTKLRFKGFLAPGCPLLVQPTALNTDAENRLWVACRGGRILTVHDITEKML